MTHSTKASEEFPKNAVELRAAPQRLMIFLLLLAAAGVPSWTASPAGAGDQGDLIAQFIWSVLYLVILGRLLPRLRDSYVIVTRSKLPLLISGIAVLSTLWSVNPALTFRRAMALFGTTLCGLYLGTEYSMRDQLRLVAKALGIAVVLSFIAGIGFPEIARMSDFGGAWRGVFNHKNTLGHIMVLSAGVFVILCRDTRTSRGSTVAFAVMSVILALLSRSATAVFLLGSFFLLMLLYTAVIRGATITRMRISVSVVVAAGLVAFAVKHLRTLLDLVGRDATLSGRAGIWLVALLAIIKRPFLGYGYDAYWSWRGTEVAGKLINFEAVHAHNGYLQMMLDIGLLGSSLFALMYCLSLVRAFRLAIRQDVGHGLWPVFLLLYGLLYNLTLPGFLARNQLFWIMMVAVYSSLSISASRQSAPCPHN